MTGTGSGVPGRADSTDPAPVRDAVRQLAAILVAGLIFRLTIAYLLPGSGFANDLAAFQGWAENLAAEGPFGFYDRPFFHDYTPGYLYVLWVVGMLGQLIGGIGDLVKVPAILADIAMAAVVWRMVRDLGGSGRRANIAAAIVVANPITWFDSVIWGQVDSVGVVVLLLAIRELWKGRPERATILAVTAALIKPQLGILAPIVAAVTIRRAFTARDEGFGDEPAPEPTGTAWERRTHGPVRILTTGVVGFLTAVALSSPFGLWVVAPSDTAPFVSSPLLSQIFSTAAGYPYLSVNAYNLWALVGLDGASLASTGGWIADAPVDGRGFVDILGIPAVVVGGAALALVIVATSLLVARRPDRLTILVGVAVLAMAFFAVPTRVHERYSYPFFALAAILGALSVRWRIAYLFASIATFANMYVVLTTLYDNPQVDDWLGIGPAIRSDLGVTIVAILHTLVFLWCLAQLHDGARRRLADEATDASLDVGAPGTDWPADAGREPHAAPPSALVDGPVTAAIAWADDPSTGDAPRRGQDVAPGRRVPAWFDRPSLGLLGPVGWLRARMAETPIRPDRSASLAREGRGHIDRLDVWIVLVLVVASLFLRTFRLAEPARMHFDEVYHARTAAEFLQDWRYGIDHDVYEWTHPHLAKYAMALGIAAFAGHDVEASGSIGVPVRDAVIEQRRPDPGDRSGYDGDRLWIATGSEVVAFDLGTRARVGAWTLAGASTLFVSSPAGSPVLYAGTDDGTLVSLDLAAVEAYRAGGADGSVALLPIASLDGPIRALETFDRTGSFAAIVGGDTVVTLDVNTGVETGRLTVAGAADLVDAGTSEATAEPWIAVSGSEGLTFVGAAATVLDTVSLEGAGGMALVSGVDDGTQVWVTTTDRATGDPTITVVSATGDGAENGPTVKSTMRLPGTASRIAYDPSAELVHALGTAPTGDGSVLYVIEPHGRSVMADHDLPFTPAAVALDTNSQYPVADRQAMLAFAGDGAMASMDVGHYAFAWRLPGVIAGALTLAVLYLLARTLFARRAVAVFVGLFVLVDGMFFVQSRIAMNDAYVGLFILAAYLLFARLWLEPSRPRWAFWVGMPTVGVLLGLALASKWVAAYAIGALGILILTRSALGRFLLVAGLLALTAVLGWMAVTVPPDNADANGNLLFVLIMMSLTLAAVAISAYRPVAWSDDELRFAIGGPVVLGILGAVGLALLGRAGDEIAIGERMLGVPWVAAPAALAAVGPAFAVALWGAGRLGFGPFSPSRPDAPPAAPAPEGWLRIGWLGGLPVIWLVGSLIAIPLVLYVVSYLPWAFNGNHRLWEGFPAGNTGQTLLELTGSMYRYHNDLTAAHAASSPWWAWPMNLKPVWFYQGGFANSTSAAIYDAGNLAIWWLGIPAMVFAAWQAYRRRSLALAIIVIGFLAQWISWARIDRAAFQYHYYTSLPFVVLALGYFMGELWHGASRRTWALARIAAGLALLGPVLLWILRGPMCLFVNVEAANPGSQACVGNPGNLEVNAPAGAIALVTLVTGLALVRALLALGRPRDDGRAPTIRDLVPLVATMAVGGAALLAAAGLPADRALFAVPGIVPEIIALLVAVPLVLVAVPILTARDARRFVVGYIVAAAAWFAILYPNISALPLPSTIASAYQGLLPSYIYAFQFPVSQIPRGETTFVDPQFALFAGALVVTAAVVGYAAWVWRAVLGDRDGAGAASAPTS